MRKRTPAHEPLDQLWHPHLWIGICLFVNLCTSVPCGTHIRGVGQFDCLYLGSQTNIKGMTERLATDLPYLIFVTGGTREETSVMWRNSTWAIVMWTNSPNLLRSLHFWMMEKTSKNDKYEVCYLLHLWHLVSSFCICFVYLLCLFCICVLFGLCF